MGYMTCPKCGTRLKEIEKDDIEIEMCPNCKGIWLDRGELEKIANKDEKFRHIVRYIMD
jgi:Zn-finger nucleic acid-binding protein